MVEKKVTVDNDASDAVKPVCGLVMPISSVDSYSEQHWLDVRRIVAEAIEPRGFTVKLVSDADESGIIQKRIVQNLYDNDVVIADVSSKNPNVMFELGLRLAFDKPTIVIKDDVTNYSFDTSPIEHVAYPRDLRYSAIVQFKDRLASKVDATHAAYKADPAYSTFLKSFGEFRVPKLGTKDITTDAFVIEMLEHLNRQVSMLRRDNRIVVRPGRSGREMSSQSFEKELDLVVRRKLQESVDLDTLPIFVPAEVERHFLDQIVALPEIPDTETAKRILTKYVNPF